MRTLAFVCLSVLSVLVLSWALPKLYDTALLSPLAKTHIFYSPVLEQCIYTEQIRGYDEQAAAKSEGHHADIVYKDETGRYYDRLAFEAALPFIYYRNMEMRGLLPLKLQGRTFDRAAIEQARRVLELPARHLDGHHPPQPCRPLLEADPGQVALVYPTDRFRVTEQGMIFTHADTNEAETELSRLFSTALAARGFVFPARHVGGNFSTFKPYEGGIFMVDARGALFHLLRRGGQPVINKIVLPEGVVPRHVLVSESRERLWLGFVLDSRNHLWLIRQSDMALIGLDVPGYVPDHMDCKLIFDPLYLTVVTSDNALVQTTVFDLPAAERKNGEICRAFHTFRHEMSRARESWQSRLADTLFPFRLDFVKEETVLLRPAFSLSRHWLLHAMPFCLLLAGGWYFVQYRRQPGGGFSFRQGRAETALILLTGLYGLITLLLLKNEA